MLLGMRFMQGVTVRIPLHVSGFWVPYYGPTPTLTGSVGAGLTLKPYLTASTTDFDDVVSLNNVEIRGGLRNSIVRLTGVKRFGVIAEAPAGLGEGFGLSAALAIAMAISAQLASQHGLRLEEAFRHAHVAEVENLTGLGDVIAEALGGGLVVRVKPGPPGLGEAFSIKVRDRINVSAVPIGRTTTPEMLKDFAGRISLYGREALAKFLRNPGLEAFAENAWLFSRLTGMMSPEVEDKVSDVLKYALRSGCVINFFVKKSLLVVIHGSECLDEVTRELSTLGRVRLLSIAEEGTSVRGA